MSANEIYTAYRPLVVGGGAVTTSGRQAADTHSPNPNNKQILQGTDIKPLLTMKHNQYK
jgi:hypothetical protein